MKYLNITFIVISCFFFSLILELCLVSAMACEVSALVISQVKNQNSAQSNVPTASQNVHGCSTTELAQSMPHSEVSHQSQSTALDTKLPADDQNENQHDAKPDSLIYYLLKDN